jgi:hypothetical protein
MVQDLERKCATIAYWNWVYKSSGHKPDPWLLGWNRFRTGLKYSMEDARQLFLYFGNWYFCWCRVQQIVASLTDAGEGFLFAMGWVSRMEPSARYFRIFVRPLVRSFFPLLDLKI